MYQGVFSVLDFSPEQQERAQAFIHAFGKSPAKTPDKTPPAAVPQKDPLPVEPVKTPFVPAPIPTPTPKKIIVDPAVFDEAPVVSTAKVNIGSEYNALKIKEDKEKPLIAESSQQKRSIFSTLVMGLLLFTLLLTLYNFETLRAVKQDQTRILNNQRVVFDKLAKLSLGKRAR